MNQKSNSGGLSGPSIQSFFGLPSSPLLRETDGKSKTENSWKTSSGNTYQLPPLSTYSILIGRQNEASLDHQDYILLSIDRKKRIWITVKKQKILAKPVLPKDVQNVDKFLEMPEWLLISECSAVGNVESVNSKNNNIIKFDAPHKIISLKNRNYKVHVHSEWC